ncbi:hypothetical protein GNI_115730 [Gregarina niphandrodes]|uniref:Uncharacterized protein n=1 Tax=Gregarina niphandrodes TaxID=110365 RepID=A0A023B2X1_GRENI|nr:hypothetical protein GNI_115730 [Gregarina niphandrodes]EZG55245.1 hypothetical protein GNI_115730 [Gregarina niphandrodes]|eukprot:XP_011131696.1 hypothetical protein GNI_115730 [Gregarina niphandrodes]
MFFDDEAEVDETVDRLMPASSDEEASEDEIGEDPTLGGFICDDDDDGEDDDGEDDDGEDDDGEDDDGEDDEGEDDRDGDGAIDKGAYASSVNDGDDEDDDVEEFIKDRKRVLKQTKRFLSDEDDDSQLFEEGEDLDGVNKDDGDDFNESDFIIDTGPSGPAAAVRLIQSDSLDHSAGQRSSSGHASVPSGPGGRGVSTDAGREYISLDEDSADLTGKHRPPELEDGEVVVAGQADVEDGYNVALQTDAGGLLSAGSSSDVEESAAVLHRKPLMNLKTGNQAGNETGNQRGWVCDQKKTGDQQVMYQRVMDQTSGRRGPPSRRSDMRQTSTARRSRFFDMDRGSTCATSGLVGDGSLGTGLGRRDNVRNDIRNDIRNDETELRHKRVRREERPTAASLESEYIVHLDTEVCAVPRTQFSKYCCFLPDGLEIDDEGREVVPHLLWDTDLDDFDNAQLCKAKAGCFVVRSRCRLEERKRQLELPNGKIVTVPTKTFVTSHELIPFDEALWEDNVTTEIVSSTPPTTKVPDRTNIDRTDVDENPDMFPGERTGAVVHSETVIGHIFTTRLPLTRRRLARKQKLKNLRRLKLDLLEQYGELPPHWFLSERQTARQKRLERLRSRVHARTFQQARHEGYNYLIEDDDQTALGNCAALV